MPSELSRSVDPRPSRRVIPRSTARVALIVILLNVVDAFGTLRNVERGAEEVNPLMAHLLDQGPLTFFVGKYLLAAVGVTGIAAYGRNRAARIALTGVLLPLYLLVASYQLLLVAVI